MCCYERDFLAADLYQVRIPSLLSMMQHKVKAQYNIPIKYKAISRVLDRANEKMPCYIKKLLISVQ